MSFFSSDAFLSVVASAYFPGQPFRIESVRVADGIYRLLVVRDRVVERVVFQDYLEPEAGSGPVDRTHGHLPHAARGIVRASAFSPELARRYEAAPFIVWSEVGGWKSFTTAARARSPVPFRVADRKRRKMERELGPVRFVSAPADRGLLELCMRWKSAQYVRTGLPDQFAWRGPRELFFGLQRRGMLTLDAVLAGERPLAIHAGVIWEGRFHYWLPAYDVELTGLSPGTVLLEELMRTSYGRDAEFDLLFGGEPYKSWYASHVRLVGGAGEPSVVARIGRRARSLVASRLRKHDQLYELARSLRRRWATSASKPSP